MKAQFLLIVFLAFALSSTCVVTAQGGGQVLFGDLDVDESKVTGLKPLSFDIILYTEGGMQVARQTVSNKGRYRFNNLGTGVFEVVVEVEGKEVARVRADLTSPLIRDLRQDISLEWRATGETRPKAGVVSPVARHSREMS